MPAIQSSPCHWIKIRARGTARGYYENSFVLGNISDARKRMTIPYSQPPAWPAGEESAPVKAEVVNANFPGCIRVKIFWNHCGLREICWPSNLQQRDWKTVHAPRSSTYWVSQSGSKVRYSRRMSTDHSRLESEWRRLGYPAPDKIWCASEFGVGTQVSLVLVANDIFPSVS